MVCQDLSDQNNASYSGCYPNHMSFASFQDVDAVLIARFVQNQREHAVHEEVPDKN